MDRSLRIGDLARIHLSNGEIQTYPVELIRDDLIYISVGPGVSSILIPLGDGYQVKDLDTPHQVEFLSGDVSPSPSDVSPSDVSPEVVESSLIGDEFLDLLLLEELDDESLEVLCDVDNYTQRLCNDDQLWKNKISELYGQSKIREKPRDMTFKEYYYHLGISPESVRRAIDLESKRLFDYLYTNYPETVEEYYRSFTAGDNYRNLKAKYPHIFQTGSANIGITGMPRIYTPAEQSYWDDHPETINGQDVPRRIFPFPPNNPELYFISPADERFKYLGYKSNPTASRDQYPVLPYFFISPRGSELHPYPQA